MNAFKAGCSLSIVQPTFVSSHCAPATLSSVSRAVLYSCTASALMHNRRATAVDANNTLTQDMICYVL